MWNKEKKGSRHSYDTLISSQAQIKGDIHFSGGLHIDGKVFGSIVAEPDSGAVVRISDQGLIEGLVRAPHVIINGSVNGDVFSSEHVELAANAVVNGTVHYKLIEMVMGAQVNGSLVHNTEPARAEKLLKADKKESLDKKEKICSVSNS
jgi:cytoskeletal protein CcmA (bactofilin family)